MLLEHRFTVPVPPAEAWVVLLDLERVAPCMPGATLQSVDGDAFTGTVKVKVGPITVTYRGKGEFTEQDEAAHRVVIEAAGKEARGPGTASATVTATLVARGEAETEVLVSTDLTVTGRPAQFGRGVMSEVGEKLIGKFAGCLADKITAGDLAPAAVGVDDATAPTQAPADPVPARGDQATSPPAAAPPPGDQGTSAPAPTPRVSAQPYVAPDTESEPIDLLEVAGGSVARRVLPPVAGLAALAIVLSWWIRRRRR